MRSETKITLKFTPDAYEALSKLASPRKRGEFVSQLVLDAAMGKTPAQPGILERVESKLDRLIAQSSLQK